MNELLETIETIRKNCGQDIKWVSFEESFAKSWNGFVHVCAWLKEPRFDEGSKRFGYAPNVFSIWMLQDRLEPMPSKLPFKMKV